MIGEDAQSDPYWLIASAHRQVLSTVCSATGCHYSGLQQAARILRPKLRSRTMRRMLHLDIAFAVARHITQASVKQLVCDIQQDIKTAAYTCPVYHMDTASTTSDGAGEAEVVSGDDSMPEDAQQLSD